MTVPMPPQPPQLGRRLDPSPDGMQFYGQVLGPSRSDPASCHPRHNYGRSPAEATAWALTNDGRWNPAVPEPGSSWSQYDLWEGEAELQLMFEVYGLVMDADGQSYAQNADGTRIYSVALYLYDRERFFGSTQAYKDYRDIALKELEADRGLLRDKLEPNIRQRPNLRRWKEAQICFYAWVRKAFEKRLGGDDKIVGIIRLGSSKAIKTALLQVGKDYTGTFAKEESNPRPIKVNGGYKLGTLSDHALGDAVDIDSGKNAQITPNQWTGIEAYTSKTLTKATRESQWKMNPQALHATFVEINAEFVRLLGLDIEAQAAAGVARDDKTMAAALVKANANLAKIGEDFLKKWKNGFFAMPWALLKEFHEEKLLWGAVFATIDLHHFEVP